MSEKPEISTEQAIMGAAEELFMDKGYARTSTIEIAKKAGCNQALIHYYYRSKENLFGLVFSRKIGLFLKFFVEVSHEELPFKEKLTKRMEAHFELLRSNRKLPMILFNEIVTNRELVQKIMPNFSNLPMPVIHQLQIELDAEYAAGQIRKTVATDLLFTIFSVNVMSFLTQPLIQMFINSNDEVMEQMLDERIQSNIATILNSLKP
jgi:AcrR family transcriptional regulator